MKERLLVLSLAMASFFLGIVYAIYNTDPHHWGFILGTALDFIRGKNLFSEIYVQYGVGQMILFKVINYAIPINYTTVGFITAFAYALNFPIIFACVKRIGNSTHAILITALAFLMHPFAVYPWPDYCASLNISLSCYFLVTAKQDGDHLRHAMSGGFLFLAFIFRNTYLLSIAATSILYICLLSFGKDRVAKNCYAVIGIFSALFAAYLAFLLYQGNFGRWYLQVFDSATSVYGYGLGSVIRMVYGLIFTENLAFTVFLGLLMINAYVIIFILVKGSKRLRTRVVHPEPSAGLFLCLLGCSGISQSVHILEIFRLQGAAVPLYLGLSYFLQARMGTSLLVKTRWCVNISLYALIALFIFRFPYVLRGSPNGPTIWPIIALQRPFHDSFYSYSNLDISLFEFHRFQPPERRYYKELQMHLCDGKRRIVNLTIDSTIPYLCPEQDRALSVPFYDEQLLRRINLLEAARVQAGEFLTKDVIVAELPPPSNKNVTLRLIGTVERPVSIRWAPQRMVSVYHVQPAEAKSALRD